MIKLVLANILLFSMLVGVATLQIKPTYFTAINKGYLASQKDGKPFVAMITADW